MRFGTRSLLVVVTLSAVAVAWLHEWRQTRPLNWDRYTPERVLSETEAGRVVLVSLYATWCITSTSNEAFVLNDPEMFRFVRNEGVVPLRADVTNGDVDGTQLMKKLGLISVPAFIIYSPHRPDDPVVLPDLTSREILRQSIAHSRY